MRVKSKPTAILAILPLIALLASCNSWGVLDNPTDPKSAVQAKLIVGTGGPAGLAGSNGDLYMDTGSAVMYVKINNAWTHVADLKGPTGPAGANWVAGAGAPGVATTASDGDLYLDTASMDVYVRAGGAWTKKLNLKGDPGATGAAGSTGAPGPQGLNGSNGATWYTGSVSPVSGTGANGDLYLNTTSLDVSVKAAGIWAVQLNLKGPTGATGATGPQGPAGPPPYTPPVRFIGNYIQKIVTNGTVCIGMTSGIGRLSYDYINWTPFNFDPNPGSGSPIPVDIAWGNNLFVGVNGGCAISANGSNWTSMGSTQNSSTLYAIVFGSNIFVAVGQSGKILNSANGVLWNGPVVSNTAADLERVAFVNGKFLATGNDVVITSSDGVTWSQPTTIFGLSGRAIAYGNGTYVIGGIGGNQNGFVSSQDGVTWQFVSYPGIPVNISFGDGHFLSISDNSATILISVDGKNWHPQTWPAVVKCGYWDGTEFLLGY